MNDILNILCLEDAPQDAEIIRELLIDSGFTFNMLCTAKKNEFIYLLNSHKHDIILSDFQLPGFDGLEALRLSMEICPETPFICVSGTVGEENAVELLKNGAIDYVLKDRLERLPSAIRRAINEANGKKARLLAERQLRIFTETQSWLLQTNSLINIYKLIARKVSELIGNGITITTILDETNQLFRVASYEGLNIPTEKITQIFKVDPTSLDYHIKDFTDDERIILHSGKLLEFERGLHSLLTRKFTKETCELAEELLKVKHIFTMGFNWQGLYLGGLIILTQNDLSQHKDTIELIVNQAVISINRVRAENKIKETQTLLQASIESPKDIIILSINKRYEYLAFNKFYEEFMKYAYGVNIKVGMNLLECIKNDDDRIKAKANYDTALKGKSFINIEEYGEIEGYFFETRYNPIYNEKNEITGATVFSVNITDRKRIETALKEAELQYRSLAENSPDLIARYDRDYRHLYVNPAAIKTGRYATKEAYLDKTIREVFIPIEGAAKWEENIRIVFETGQCTEIDDHFQTQQGLRHLNTRFVPERNAKGMVLSVLSISRDITERYHAENAIRKNEEIFNSFMEYCPIYIFFKDQDAKPIRLSKNYEQLLGLPIEKVIGKSMLELFPSEMAKKMIDDDLNVIKNNEPTKIIEQFNNRHYESTKFPIVIKDQPSLLAGFTVDITDQVNNEKELKEKIKLQELLAKIAETVPGLIISLRQQPNGTINIPYASVATEQIFGLRAKDAIGSADQALSLIHTDDIERVLQKLNESASSLSQFRDEWRINHPTKGEIWVEGNTMPIKEPDGSTIWHGFFQDITERKLVESRIQKLNEDLEIKVAQRTTELQETLTLVENIMLSTTVGFCVFNAKGDCILANDAMANILGTTKEQLLKQNQHQIESWKKTGLYELSINSISEQITNSKEVYIQTSFGKEIWLDYKFTPFIANNKYNLLLTVSDINERVKREREIKELNEELQVHIEQLELVNKELEAFSYSVSHDLRAPLRAIHGFLNILEENFKEKLDDENLKLMSLVKDNALRMAQLIDQLLSFSRINRSEIKKTTIDTNSLVHSTYLEYTNPEQRKTIKFSVSKLPNIIGDSNLFHQVWANLISNAIKYSSKVEKPEIEIGVSELQDAYEFYIKDNGAGFDMHYADKLFGVFQRLHSDSEFEGIGVGLAIVQRIVNRHGGRIWANGEVDKGATFYFTAPKKSWQKEEY